MATDISNGDFAYAEEYPISSGGLDMATLRTSAANGIISFGWQEGGGGSFVEVDVLDFETKVIWQDLILLSIMIRYKTSLVKVCVLWP